MAHGLTRRIINSLKLRLTGGFKQQLKISEYTLEQIQRIKEKSMPGSGLLLLCEHRLIRRIVQLKTLRILPSALGGMRLAAIRERAYKAEVGLTDYEIICSDSSTYNEGRLHLRDVVLPAAASSKSGEFYPMALIDTLLPYVLEGYTTKEIARQINDAFTAEGPYELNAVTLDAGDIVIDAGSWIGDFAALASVKGCHTYAFEPVANLFANFLTKTAAWNKNITACPFALSDSNGYLTIENSQVQATSLDSFVHENNLPRVDFIKADIEGAERYLLKGAKNVLKEFAPKIAICTYHLPDDPKVLRELILEANPKYSIEEQYLKMYAHVPK